MKQTFILTLCVVLCAPCINAQSSTLSLDGTTSPYSRYGVGILNEGGTHASTAMGGVGYGLRTGRSINDLNPASYSATDSLTFLFEAGVSGICALYSENGSTKSFNNSSLDYLQLGFRLRPGLGIAAGLRPYSSIGYNFGKEGKIEDPVTQAATDATFNYFGNGGTKQVFAGVGFAPTNRLSLGIQAAYLFGELNKAVSVTSTAYTSSTVRKSGTINVYDYKIQAGAQYVLPLNAQREQALTFGAVYSPGHTSRLTMSAITGTSTEEFKSPFKFADEIGAGALYTDPQLTIGLDYNLQLWQQNYYEALNNNTTGTNTLARQNLLNRHRVSAGGEWTPNRYSNTFFRQLRYRAGLHYTTPYTQVKTASGQWQDGAIEWGVSAGVGIPFRVLSRSLVNLTLGYVHSSAPSMLTENVFRISLGVTFNEAWFRKWRVE